MRVDGVEIPLLDAGSETGETTNYSNFILQQVQEQRMERHQIIETFGDTYVFLFGAAPHMLMCSAVLINSHDFNWKDEFMENYQRYMRGTKALEYGARTYLFYDQNVVEGYMLNASVSIDAQNPLMAQLEFQFFVTNAQSIAMLGDPWFPTRDSVQMPEGVTLVETWNGEITELVLDQTMEGSSYWLRSGSGSSSAPSYPGVPAGALPPKGNNLLAGVNNWVNGDQEDIDDWLKEQQAAENTLFDNTAKSVTDTAAINPIRQWVRDRPMREKTYAVDSSSGLMISDEYTTPMQPTSDDISMRKWAETIEIDLERALNDIMGAYGAEGFEDPSFWEKIGLQPHWTENGISFGNGSTPFSGGVSWGSFSGSDKIGGWVGNAADIPDVLGDVGDTLKGLPGPFGTVGRAVVGSAEDAGDFVGDKSKSGYDWAAGKVTSALAASKNQREGAASDAARAAAKAGGYVGGNEYLSWIAKNAPVRVDSSMNSTGASNDIPGSPVPFAFVSLPGTLINEGIPPEAIIGNQPKPL
jgi:hypothetical protein